MSLHVVNIGLNHKTAPIHIREKVSFCDGNIENSYDFLRTYQSIEEAFILSTCNRVEIYGVGENVQNILKNLKDFLYRSHEMTLGNLDEYISINVNIDAIDHLYRVASGIDSSIIGENQILGQIRQAYQTANGFNMVGSSLHKILQDALRIGKRVRTQTHISRGVTSLPGAALELIKNEGSLKDKTVLVVGAGKIGAITLKKLLQAKVKEIVLINRDRTKAQALADDLSVTIGHFPQLMNKIKTADIIVTATSSMTHVITKKMMESILCENSKEFLLIDLGVPRNIEKTLKEFDQVRLFNVDDLGQFIIESIQKRKKEVHKAERIIKSSLCEKLPTG